MAGVNLPNVEGMTSLVDLKNAVGKMTKELSWLLNNLDTRNLNYVDGDLLVEGTVTALKLQVEELSAISANLGKIVSGEVYGAYIATREGTFPRAEINNTGDLLAVYTDANNYMTIEPGLFNEPTQVFRKGGTTSLVVGPIGILVGVLSNDLDMAVGSQNGSLQLVCGTGILDNISVPSWSKLRSEETGNSLQDEIDTIWAALAGKAAVLHSHSVTIPNHNHGNLANSTSGGGTFTVS